MLTQEEHAQLLRGFEVDRLLKLVTIEAKRLHDGHFTILAFTTCYKVAFGTPNIYPLNEGMAYAQVTTMPSAPTLKEALIAALVAGKDFEDYFSGDGSRGGPHSSICTMELRRTPSVLPRIPVRTVLTLRRTGCGGRMSAACNITSVTMSV
jgi:hypothetical protein